MWVPTASSAGASVHVGRPWGREARVVRPQGHRHPEAGVAGIARTNDMALARGPRDRSDTCLRRQLSFALEALRCVAQLGYDLSRVQASCSRKRHHDLAQRQLFNRGLDLRGECADLGDEHLEHRDQTLDQRALDGLFAQTDETLRRRPG